MKKFAFLTLACLLFGSAVFSQELSSGQVPSPVKQAFARQFPAAMAVQYERNNTFYKVLFLDQGKQCAASYDGKGKLIESEKEIAPDKLPGAVSSAVSKNFPGYTVIVAVRREAFDKGVCFEMDLKKDNAGYSVRFSDTGEVLQKEARRVEVKMITKPKR